jgi:two-component system sensor histidine kinase BaeS
MLAFVGLVAGVLVIAGAGSIILTHNAARNQATQQLVSEAQSLTAGTSQIKRLATLTVIRKVLRLEDARFVVISPLGVVRSGIPPGLTSTNLDPQKLLAGLTVSGQQGGLVFAAAPVTLTIEEQSELPPKFSGLRFGGQIAIVLTRQVGDVGPSWGYFLASGAVALLIAALVASMLSRRMSRPLVEAMEATARIAAGDLQSRVPRHPRDFAESASLASSINEMAQSLEAGRDRERQLLLSVSHDLRTPLTSIRGFAEAITDGAIDDTAQAAEVIIAESRRLERLVGDLLDLTKLEGNQMSITIRPTDVSEVVSTTAEGFRPLARRSGIELAVHLPEGDVPAVMADPDRLAQIVANLVENAFTFARSSVTVRLSAADPPGGSGRTIISVDDDGPGIASGDLTRVFERFYQADHGPNRPYGSGLGLAIVAELAAAMGAHVRAVSPVSPDGGSRFEVSLTPVDRPRSE